MMVVHFIGGPLDGVKVKFLGDKYPPRAQYGGHIYKRLNDPDTAEFLGGYFYVGEYSERTSTPASDLLRMQAEENRRGSRSSHGFLRLLRYSGPYRAAARLVQRGRR